MKPVFLYKAVFVLFSLSILGGCAVHQVDSGPSPDIAVKLEGYSSLQNNDILPLKAEQGEWWREFKNPELSKLISKALVSNQDLAQAVAKVKQAQALAVTTRGDIAPEVSLEASSSGEARRGHLQRGSSSAGAALNWELDFFGRITSAAKVASYTAEARKADVAAVKLSLSAEVATAYFNAIAAHKKLSLLEERLKNSQKLLSLQNMRLDEGLGTSLDMLQQKKLVSEVAQLIPAAKADVRLYENRLDVLLGEMPDGKNRVSSKSSLDFAKNLPSLGVPSDLLASRPDLLAIKAELVSADAGVAEAIASRMPRITLTGSHAFADGSSFTGPLSLLTATFVQPLIDWGKKRAEVERNQYIYKEKLAQYTQQYLQAVEDVEAAIYQERRQRETVEEVLEQKTVMRRVLKGAKARYTQGVDDYIPSLTALEEMSKIKESLLEAKLDLINFRVQLYRSIGGSIVRS